MINLGKRIIYFKDTLVFFFLFLLYFSSERMPEIQALASSRKWGGKNERVGGNKKKVCALAYNLFYLMIAQMHGGAVGLTLV